MLRKYRDYENRFVEVFDTSDGFYLRSGILDDFGKDTEVDPFMRQMPNLIDIGIMGHCVHGKSGLCLKSGVQCYQNGLEIHKPNMRFYDYKTIIDEVKDHVFQVALGGRGDPNQHERFEDFLAYAYHNGVTPNYTTSGLGLTPEMVELTRKYCGAVAVSYYRNKHTYAAIKAFTDAEIITNIHYVLAKNTIDEAIYNLRNDGFPIGVNAVVFLLHKPVGLGKHVNCLSPDDEKVKEFFDLIDNWKGNFQIGFDSCSIAGVLNLTKNISKVSIDACEAARFSMYISADMIAVPCSFDAKAYWGVDLFSHSIKEAWNSQRFNDFRAIQKGACPGCGERSDCYGGCPIVPSITLCGRKERTT